MIILRMSVVLKYDSQQRLDKQSTTWRSFDLELANTLMLRGYRDVRVTVLRRDYCHKVRHRVTRSPGLTLFFNSCSIQVPVAALLVETLKLDA